MKDEIKEMNLSEMLFNRDERLLDIITNLREKVNQYENPDDMTLMFMWCDEKAKNKIKQLQEENEKLQKELEKLQRENNVLRSLVPNNEEYYFSVR